MTYPEGAIDTLRRRGSRFVGDPPRSTPNEANLSPVNEDSEPVYTPSSEPSPKSLEEERPVTKSTRKRTGRSSTSSSPSSSSPSSASSPSSPSSKKGTTKKKRATSTTETATDTKKPKRFRWLKWMLGGIVLSGGLGIGAVVGTVNHFSKEVPSVEELRDYEPPTVTTLYDRNGAVLAELYKKRRYVREYEAFPQHLIEAFMAAEDANFLKHSGIDYMGIVRAVLRNALKGKKAQGASTITQQVARNFLLTSEKTYTRKIKEVILAQRIEETFDKEHIIYLYLNQIYLGSGAYGVEAASRAYFNKHVEDLTLAESAIIAGLPQRPADYSPHRHWKKARARQEYVLRQLLEKKFIDQATHDAALNEKVRVYKEENKFLAQAPHYTEYVRRYLLETYGEDKIYNDGLEVVTACDLELQQVAQKAVYEQVAKAGRSQGWEGATKTLQESEFEAFRQGEEKKLLEASRETGLIVAEQEAQGSGPFPLPENSTLTAGTIYDAVVLEVTRKHAFVGIGSHEAIVPLSWSKWGYKPDFNRSFKRRALRDLRDMLKKGDVVQVRVETLDAQTEKNLKGYKPIKDRTIPAAQVWKEPELEGALFSYRVTNSDENSQDRGAVISMVGGYDFAKSQFNRATQARRQVGSTIKPIVYSAGIESKKFTVASQIPDAPLTYQTFGDKLWKPGNYGNSYSETGYLSLRQALQKSKNVCTIRVLDEVNLESIFDIAGPRLRIGYDTPVQTRTHISKADACEGTTTPSPVEGMQWCETIDPTSCPLVRANQKTIEKNGQTIAVDTPKTCLDTPFSKDGEEWCHSCDVNLRVCDWLPLEQIPETDPCVDARMGKNGIMCRTCDLSMGLGSSSLTMVELVRAYSAFATYGNLIEPYFIESVKDRDGTVIEEHTASEPKQVMDPTVAGITNWLLVQVATGGTGAKTNSLKLHLAGKTGTTNDFFDAWFVGYNPDILTASWVGYDTPKSMGQTFTGGDIALPMWMNFMRQAVPEERDTLFPPIPDVTWATINESNGQLASDGRRMPFIPGTEPTNIMGSSTQATIEDLLLGDF